MNSFFRSLYRRFLRRQSRLLARQDGTATWLRRQVEDARQREWTHRQHADGLREIVALQRVQLGALDIRPAGESPTAHGSYLVWLAGSRVWHEAYWANSGWRVLVRSTSPVTHWRRMPPGPADRPLPYTPPTAEECPR